MRNRLVAAGFKPAWGDAGPGYTHNTHHPRNRRPPISAHSTVTTFTSSRTPTSHPEPQHVIPSEAEGSEPVIPQPPSPSRPTSAPSLILPAKFRLAGLRSGTHGGARAGRGYHLNPRIQRTLTHSNTPRSGGFQTRLGGCGARLHPQHPSPPQPTPAIPRTLLSHPTCHPDPPHCHPAPNSSLRPQPVIPSEAEGSKLVIPKRPSPPR